MAEKFVSDVSQGNANENEKRIGKIIGEIAICVIVDHGVGMLNDIISESGKYFGTYGNWELGINTETGVVYHAIMK